MRLIRFDTDPVFATDIPAGILWLCAIAGDPFNDVAEFPIPPCSPESAHSAGEGCRAVEVVDVISPASLAHELVAAIIRFGEHPHPARKADPS